MKNVSLGLVLSFMSLTSFAQEKKSTATPAPAFRGGGVNTADSMQYAGKLDSLGRRHHHHSGYREHDRKLAYRSNPVITYDISKSEWNREMKSLHLECNSNFTVRIKGYNPFKYDISLGFNDKTYTSDMPQLLKDAFDPSALVGMIDGATGVAVYKMASSAAGTSTKGDTAKAAKTKQDSMKALLSNKMSTQELFHTNMFDLLVPNNEAFIDSLNRITARMQVTEQEILKQLSSLQFCNYELYMKMYRMGVLPDGKIQAVNFSTGDVEEDYTALMQKIDVFNGELLELTGLDVVTTDNTTQLKPALTHATTFLTRIKPVLVSEVANYYNLRAQAAYFEVIAEEWKTGAEIQLLYVCDDQLDIDVELVPKSMTILYNAPVPGLNLAPVDTTTTKAPAKKAAVDTKKKPGATSANPTPATPAPSTPSPVPAAASDPKATQNYTPVINIYNTGSAADSKKSADTTKSKKAGADSTKNKPAMGIYKYHLPKQTLSVSNKSSFMSYSTGFFGSGLTSDKYTWETTFAPNATSKDSVKLIKEKTNKNYSDFGLLAQAHYVPAGLNFIDYSIGFNVGAGINIPDLRLRYTGGVCFITGKKNQLIISAGVMLGQIDELSNAFTTYASSGGASIVASSKPSDVYTRVWDAKAFVSLSYGFRYIKPATTAPQTKP